MIYEHFLEKRDHGAQMRQSLAVVQFMFRLILWVSGVKVTVEGRENIPEDQAVLYVDVYKRQGKMSGNCKICNIFVP